MAENYDCKWCGRNSLPSDVLLRQSEMCSPKCRAECRAEEQKENETQVARPKTEESSENILEIICFFLGIVAGGVVWAATGSFWYGIVGLLVATFLMLSFGVAGILVVGVMLFYALKWTKEGYDFAQEISKITGNF